MTEDVLFNTLYFKVTEMVVTENKDTGIGHNTSTYIKGINCKEIYKGKDIKGYLFRDNKIKVYYGDIGTGSSENPVDDEKWFIKLTINKPKKYMYIDFLRTPTEKGDKYLATIMEVIKDITKALYIQQIVLQDDAHFYCDKYPVKGLYLRALDSSKPYDKLSIYQKYGFNPVIKEVDVKGCIETLRGITCYKLYNDSLELLGILQGINNVKYSIYKIYVETSTLNISYDTIRNTKFVSSPIISRYKNNLEELIRLLQQPAESDRNILVYDYYKNLCKEETSENDVCCNWRTKFLSCLENTVNSHVIIVEGVANVEGVGVPSTCDLEIPKNYNGNPNPIIITKLFNIFYGTFERIKYIYFEMSCDVSK